MEAAPPERPSWLLRPIVRWSFLLIVAIVVTLSVVSKGSRSSNSAEGYYIRGIEEIRKERYEEGIASLNLSLARAPDVVDSYVARGFARNRLGDRDGAIADYNRAIELDPSEAKAWAGRAFVRTRRGEHKEAIEDYSRAMEAEPRDSDYPRGRGFVKEKIGDAAGALADYDAAVGLDPKNGRGYFRRGGLYLDLGRFKEALEDLRTARDLLQVGPDRDHACLLAWCARVRMGDAPGAKGELLVHVGLRGKSRDADDWAWTISHFLMGEMDEPALMEAAGGDGGRAGAEGGRAGGEGGGERRCEALYYAAMRRILEGDRPAALDRLRQCLATDAPECYVLERAAAELRR